MDRNGGQAALHFVVVPNGAGLGDVAPLRGVDGIHVAGPLAVLGILAHGDVHPVLVNHRRGDQLVPRAPAAELVDRALGIALEATRAPCRRAYRLVGVQPAVAAGKDHLLHAADHADRRAGPLAVEDLVARPDLVPHDLARLLVHGDEAGCVGRGDDDVAFVDAVAGDDVHQVAVDIRRAGRHVVGEDAQLLHHVELPEDLAGPRGCPAAAVGPFDVGTDQFAAVADVVDAIAVDVARRADALLGPVVHAAGGELVVDDLPEELAVGLAEAHHHALVALDLGLAFDLVVCADEDLAAGDHGVAERLRAELGDPLDVLARGDIPTVGDVLLHGIDHVALRLPPHMCQSAVKAGEAASGRKTKVMRVRNFILVLLRSKKETCFQTVAATPTAKRFNSIAQGLRSAPWVDERHTVVRTRKGCHICRTPSGCGSVNACYPRVRCATLGCGVTHLQRGN